MRRIALFALTVTVLIFAPQVSAQSSAGDATEGPGFGCLCGGDLGGSSICITDNLCGSASDCDAGNPCVAGFECVVNECCNNSPTLGKCLAACDVGEACTNAGTCGTFEPCSLLQEDFSTGLGLLAASTACGSGSSWFMENACFDSGGAPTPPNHAAWGSAPGDCTTFSLGDSQVVVETPPIDITGCKGAVVTFSYLIDIEEAFVFDRVFVQGVLDGQPRVLASNLGSTTVAPTISCGGTPYPVGSLTADGAWHHKTVVLGRGSSVQVRFWGETPDEEFNAGQGFFVDNVRVACSDEVFTNGFDGGNTLLWRSASPAREPNVTDPQICGEFMPCDGPGGNCLSFEIAEGGGRCLSDFPCSGTPCPGGSSDCGPGEVCTTNTCCGSNVCAPASCDPWIPGFESTGPTGAFRN